MTEHSAIICRIKVRPHPNADRLQLAQVGGAQVVVGMNTVDDELVVYFDSELAVSPEYLQANDLLPRGVDPVTGERLGGYFPKNGKVRPQRFRGERSDGFVSSLESLLFTGVDPELLVEGFAFNELNGVPVAAKYVNPRTKNSMASNKTHPELSSFPKHYDTEQFARRYQDIPSGSLITVSVKTHGTSARTACLEVDLPRKRTLLDKILRRTRTEKEWVVVNGTRNTVLDNAKLNVGWYGDETFRTKAAATFADLLHHSEIVYYELVGWAGQETTIMSEYDLTSSKDFKKWGRGVFSYGMQPGECGIFVYRITQQVIDCVGNVQNVDLPMAQVAKRCREMSLDMVPILDRFVFDATGIETADMRQVLLERVMSWVNLAEHGDFIDSTHPCEGVVVRVDTADGASYALKAKTLTFKVAEGIIKESDSVDLEEIS